MLEAAAWKKSTAGWPPVALPTLSPGVAAKPPKKAADLPPPSIYWEKGAVAVMRRNWNRDDARIVVLFAGQTCEIELVASGRVAASGAWRFEITQQGQQLQPVSHWESSCWYYRRRCRLPGTGNRTDRGRQAAAADRAGPERPVPIAGRRRNEPAARQLGVSQCLAAWPRTSNFAGPRRAARGFWCMAVRRLQRGNRPPPRGRWPRCCRWGCRNGGRSAPGRA